MSLQVWLPLNGTLDNIGCSGVTVTNNGATVDNSGKIGKCYYFNGSTWIKMNMPEEMTTIKNTSVCAWVKSTGTVVALGGISHDSGPSRAHMTLYTSGWQFAGGSRYKYVSGGTIANTSIWHHVCCTLDDTTITTYLDGTKVTSKTLTEAGVTVTDITSANFLEIGCDHPGSNEFLTGYVNDFRVYSHCLSAAEVKEISQGLVLHYKLDDLTNEVLDSSGYNHNGTIIGTATLVSSPRYSFGTAMNNTSTANRIEYEGLPTETQTVSLWVKGNKSTNQVYFTDKNSTLQFGIYRSLGTTNTSSKPLYNLDNFISNEWNHIVVIKNSTNNKLYINGVAATTNSSSNHYAHSAKLYLFNRNTNNNYACNGAISDFRAYVTALTDDQIRQLYEVGAKVDNLQNLHTFELVENNLKTEINKRGQLICNGLNEDTATKFYKSGNLIETNEIIEC